MRNATILAVLALIATPAAAQQAAHQGMNHSMQPTAANPYGPAEMKMHERMMGATGADASETWVRKMIEHHRGAIDMSRTAIARARDPMVKRMAQKGAMMQEKEIGELQAWLRRNGKRAQ
ncbi:hypothetical protein ASE86_07720 [Sphingomonas sp. Leaf33]|uniref:DUF305 domain-containing protein n=1 Tax=Sphingomonas sp. Leaf33 TaxID=1736215 RepID=UPI0006FC1020|nr:DUF305 domain-containing protein [Sphingomonas sp. Leaf33]KQN26917.1 hypothetical protein ASE86_07720 [Sphingomonas sp. Leaf33]